MHHFIMGEWQQEALIVLIEHGEGQLVIISAAILRIGLEVFQCVVHPTHIPLVVKAQAPLVNRLCYIVVSSGILRS